MLLVESHQHAVDGFDAVVLDDFGLESAVEQTLVRFGVFPDRRGDGLAFLGEDLVRAFQSVELLLQFLDLFLD